MTELPDIPQREPEPPTAAELLQQLCERQRKLIQNLMRELADEKAQSTETARTLLKASQERAAKLVDLQRAFRELTERTRRVVGERYQIETSLRALVAVLDLIGSSNVPDRFQSARSKALREARELITVIDQIRKARGETRPD